MVSSTLIGFVLLITSATAEPMPVSERIYPNEFSCEAMRLRILEIRPKITLECAQVMN